MLEYAFIFCQSEENHASKMCRVSFIYHLQCDKKKNLFKIKENNPLQFDFFSLCLLPFYF